MKPIVLLFIVVLMASCQKSNNNNSSSTGAELPYIVVGQNVGAGHDSIVYHYDAQNRISSVVRPLEFDSITLQYDASSNITIENAYNLSPVSLYGQTSFSYNSTLITATTTAPSSTEKYTLNAGGQLSIYDPIVSEKEQYYYDGPGDVTKVEYSSSSCSGICYTNNYMYDSKNGIFSTVKTPKWWLIKSFDFSNLQSSTGIVHNVIQENDTYFTNSTTTAFKYTMIYDAAGYPISIKDDKGGINYTVKYVASK